MIIGLTVHDHHIVAVENVLIAVKMMGQVFAHQVSTTSRTTGIGMAIGALIDVACAVASEEETCALHIAVTDIAQFLVDYASVGPI